MRFMMAIPVCLEFDIDLPLVRTLAWIWFDLERDADVTATCPNRTYVWTALICTLFHSAPDTSDATSLSALTTGLVTQDFARVRLDQVYGIASCIQSAAQVLLLSSHIITKGKNSLALNRT